MIVPGSIVEPTVIVVTVGTIIEEAGCLPLHIILL